MYIDDDMNTPSETTYSRKGKQAIHKNSKHGFNKNHNNNCSIKVMVR